MTFHISPIVAKAESPFETTSHCFCCGEKLDKPSDGPIVVYDAYPSQPGDQLVSMLMHRDCAFAMAQRIICDAWPNRSACDAKMLTKNV